MKIAAIDFETADTGPDSACALGIAVVEGHKIVHKKSYLIKPPRKEFEFTYIHGITWRKVRNSPTFAELVPELNEIFNEVDYIAAHNAGFDRKVLLNCYYEADEPIKPLTTLCTVKLARKVWDIRPTTLPDVCDYHNIPLKHHDALSDTLACAKIIIKAQKEGFDVTKAALGKPSYTVGASKPKRRTVTRDYEDDFDDSFDSDWDEKYDDEPEEKKNSGCGWVILMAIILYFIFS